MLATRLRLARIKQSYTQEQLAKAVRITKQAISKYERDLMLPELEVLHRMARELGVSMDYLMSSQVASIEKIEYRKGSGATARDKAKAEVQAAEVIEKYLLIESYLDIELPKDTVAKIRTDAKDFEHAEQLAIKLRKLWKIGNDPIPSVSELLERNGFKLIEVDMPDKIHALTFNVKLSNGEVDKQIIVIGKSDNIERKRFNLAHELGHKIISGTNNKNNLEKIVDRFAGAFLVPKDHLLQLVGKKRHNMNYAELRHLKHIYRVSAAAMLMRLKQTGILPEHYVDSLFRHSSEIRKWRKQEPDPIDNINEQPQMFELLVWRALSEKIIPPIKGAVLMNVPLSEVEEQICKVVSK